MSESAAARYERAIVARSVAEQNLEQAETSDPPFNEAARSVARTRAAKATTEIVEAQAAYIKDRTPKR